MSNSQYNILKHAAMIGLPALVALYGALAGIWHWPHTDQVLLSIGTVNTVLGGLLGYSTATYNASSAKYAGVIQVVETDAKKIAQLVLNDEPENVLSKAEAVFKIVASAPSTIQTVVDESPSVSSDNSPSSTTS